MIIQEDKANRVPRVKKAVSKEKLVEKLNYLKTDSNSKLVSINPVTIIGAAILWCYDSKTKKLFRYLADEIDGPLSVKGTTIIGYDPNKSIGKTIRKPAEQLAIFKAGSNTAINKFFDSLTTVEIKANGRINPNQILVKVH
jgi:triosephosphate isomerase